MENHEHENACERYLLGEMSEQEQAHLEESYFADDALFERFLAVKEDLIDAYARGGLTGQKRAQFEQHFLNSEPRRQRVEEAREFIRAVTAASTNAVAVNRRSATHTAPSTSWWQLILEYLTRRPLAWQGALAALLIVALAGSWLLVRRFQSQRASVVPPVNENRSDLAGNKPTDLNGSPSPAIASNAPTPDRAQRPTPDKQPQPMPAQVASLFLSPFSPRDVTGSNSLILRPDTSAIRLHLALKRDDYRHYVAILKTLDGEQVLSRRGLKAGGAAEKSVTITLDPSVLHRQDYIITLSGFTANGKLEAIGEYYFRVERSAPQSAPTPNQ